MDVANRNVVLKGRVESRDRLVLDLSGIGRLKNFAFAKCGMCRTQDLEETGIAISSIDNDGTSRKSGRKSSVLAEMGSKKTRPSLIIATQMCGKECS